ncbi:FecR family protein [Wenyingzhuangia aestuarii]|uniref:FecR family protein n=1 Tax=Wenyingzhuangia aestuarii TaxID=1647582 RepID=UPI00143A9E7B|nr:FecR family protein [Wenyingzhuangia aestuarii]NJB82497.1 ferric-dicitrate binding protein FerR (iron transport regulator) [Wenyingzhuangia aestuarii]
MTEKELKELINKRQKGNLSKEEQKVLELFEEKMLAKNEQHIFFNDRHKSMVEQEIYSNIHKAKNKKFISAWLRIAAILVLSITVAGGSWYFSSKLQIENTYAVAQTIIKRAEYGKKLTVTLPDGSIVNLNSGSEIRFPETFNKTTREVTLTGEAFFNVQKNPTHPFIVKTPMVTTKVLGTTFNIKAYQDQDDVEVTLATGKISVGIQGEDEMILTPSYQVNFNKKSKSIQKQKVVLAQFLGWKDGVLSFDDEKLATAIPKLEKWFNVKIHLEDKNSQNCSFTGVFKNASLKNILDNITFVKPNLSYKFISSKEIQILGKCNH